MASLKDIANICGVSIATVSKALNNHSDIGEETKERIRQIAKEMGYQPNSQARALKTNRTMNIGVLFVDEAMSGLTHDYFADVLEKFKRQVESQGYDITFINVSPKGRNGRTILEYCRYRRFDGVIIACIDFSDQQVVELMQSEIPIVTIDYTYHNKSAVLSDNVTGMYDLVSYIYKMGHRRIAYITGADSSVTKSRLSSFYRTAESLGIEVPDEYVIHAAYRDSDSAGAATEKLLDLPNPPTCIIYPDDLASLGGLNVLRERSLRVPEDISIAGYDGIRIGQYLEPNLTTIRQNCLEIGTEAGKKLIETIEKPKTTLIEQIVIKGHLIEGKTVKNLKEK